ncbi:MAG: carboxypeptidase-like regulatory domain-containing protein [Chloroflexi bacterium]|nr:carboxypeptidase-like regulatory domain-containing protein [Chloroflexota bacterium]MCI0648400.1 carboxypeptidase-like regulatory domain-containing protein [Chloroflexota bacterium]MCI0727521.1 carboxypeptidase-like regulatory domain-containing protein [Chloroflexota bacterium]
MPYHPHDIEEIEGIGLIRGAAMRTQGITITEELLVYSVVHLRRLVRNVPNFPERKIAEYQVHATLMQVPGLSGQHAEALYRASRRSLLKLAVPQPSVIVRELDQAVAAGAIPESIDVAEAMNWQKRAIVLAYTGKIYGRITSAGPDGEPIAGATVYAGTETAVTNADGKYWLPLVTYGENNLIVHAEGYRRSKVTANVAIGKVARHNFRLLPGRDEERVVDEFHGQAIGLFDADDQFAFVDVELGDLPEGTPLFLNYRYKNGNIRLLSVYRKQTGRSIEVWRVTAPGTFVDTNAPLATVFYWEGGALRRTDETIYELREKIFWGHLRR